MNKLLTLTFCGFLCLFSYSQREITVTESIITLDGNKEESIYFGFAQGDQIIISLQSKKGRFLSEIEVSELNGSVKFSDYKIKKIKAKTIDVLATGIYKFKFSNATSREKVYSLVIKRTPASAETQTFNTTVYWRTEVDTTYTEKKEKYLIRKDTSVVSLIDQRAKVHSTTNLDGNKNAIKFKLPAHTVAWSYYIGVDQAGQQAYEEASNDLSDIASGVSAILELNPETAILLGLAHLVPAMQKGEDVKYYITDYDNAQLFYAGSELTAIKRGTVINDCGRQNANPDYNGNYYVCLYNDNTFYAIDVMVKVSALVVEEEWGTKTVKVPHVNKHEEAYLMN